MSKGPGVVERRIADLFAATRDRALSVSDIADYAFELGGQPPTRVQRLSATRAAHRLLRRMCDTSKQYGDLYVQARRNAETAIGVLEEQLGPAWEDPRRQEFYELLHADPAYRRAEALHNWSHQFGTWVRILRVEGTRDRLRAETEYWRATIGLDHALYFHPPDVRLWAVSVQPAGVIWAEAEVVRITERNVIARYAGDTARLNRKSLWEAWALWRGVMFVSSQSGYAAGQFDRMWWDRYGPNFSGAVPPAMAMPLAEAMALLGVPFNYTREDILAAFRREAKKAHPDAGGTAEMFRKLVEARDRLLASIGTSAPAPKAPSYAPAGVKVVYRTVRLDSGRRRLGSTRRLVGA
jgi:hypothetical protein